MNQVVPDATQHAVWANPAETPAPIATESTPSSQDFCASSLGGENLADYLGHGLGGYAIGDVVNELPNYLFDNSAIFSPSDVHAFGLIGGAISDISKIVCLGSGVANTGEIATVSSGVANAIKIATVGSGVANAINIATLSSGVANAINIATVSSGVANAIKIATVGSGVGRAMEIARTGYLLATEAIAALDPLLLRNRSSSNATIPTALYEAAHYSAAAALIRLQDKLSSMGRDPALRAPTKLAVAAAETFISSVARRGLNVPQILIDESGEILLFGRRGRSYLDVGFQDDGTVSYFGRRGDGEESTGDDLDPSAALSPALERIIREIT